MRISRTRIDIPYFTRIGELLVHNSSFPEVVDDFARDAMDLVYMDSKLCLTILLTRVLTTDRSRLSDREFM